MMLTIRGYYYAHDNIGRDLFLFRDTVEIDLEYPTSAVS